ncbi:hypothetical protein ACHAWF_008077 [Thalassiosira exigua]
MPSSSSVLNDGDGGEVKRDVPTGTAHNKSIRSYHSALPDGPPLPTDASKKPPKDRPPAKEYPFSFHPYQKQKTIMGYAKKNAVAKYAVAKSLRDGERVVYISPIKALSNQKYRDLYKEEEFKNVGLMVGDITINSSATCLVMTTEILRSILYRGSEVMCEVAWVIRRVHYMCDKERGVVGEEIIALLPHKVGFDFLGATILSVMQLVGWIAMICHSCYVV